MTKFFLLFPCAAMLFSGCGESIGEAAGAAIAKNISEQVDINQTLHSDSFQYIDENGKVHTVQLGKKIDPDTIQKEDTAYIAQMQDKIDTLEKALNEKANDQQSIDALQKKIEQLETQLHNLEKEKTQAPAQSVKPVTTTHTDNNMLWDWQTDKLFRSDLSKLYTMMPQSRQTDSNDRKQILKTIDYWFQRIQPLDTLEVKSHVGSDGIETVIKRYDINQFFKLYLEDYMTSTAEEKHKYIVDMMKPDLYRLYLGSKTGWSNTWSDFTRYASDIEFNFINPAQTDAREYASYNLRTHRFDKDSANKKIWKVVSFQLLIPANNFFGTVGYADPKRYVSAIVFDVLYYKDQKYDWEYRAGLYMQSEKKNTPRGVEFFTHVIQFD